MVHQFFSLPRMQRYMLEGPLGPYIDEFAGLMHEQGFRPSVAKRQIGLLADFSRWLKRQGLQVKDVDSKRISGYLQYRHRRCQSDANDSSAFNRFLVLLRSKDSLLFESPPAEKSTSDILVENYGHYLSEERGLVQTTISYYSQIAQRFLVERFGKKPLRFDQLLARDITRYVQRYAQDHTPKISGVMGTGLRSFLRYLRHQGCITMDLAAVVPCVANWQLATLPRFLSISQIQCILNACDRDAPGGRRDYAVMMLLARLGLRACEVVSLTLDDIRWDTGEITIQGKGPRKSRMPLPHEVGRALSNYLQKGRPPCSSRRFFILARAPHRGFANSSGVSTVVRRALQRSGVSSVGKGAHLFRHSLATNMLRQGARISDIGDLLRHRSINTTAIYAKVDFKALRHLAQPWPGDVQ